MVNVLLLNASFEPLAVVKLSRAIGLLMDGKVEVIESMPGRELRSAHLRQPMPSVLRLRYYVNVPRRGVGWSRLDEATQLLRDAPRVDIPAGLVAATVDALRNTPAPVVRRRTIGSLAVRLGSIAATILLALAGVTDLMTQGGARVALAQVLDRVKEADSVEFANRHRSRRGRRKAEQVPLSR